VTKERILITGATGTVGAATITELMNHPAKATFDVVAGLRDISRIETRVDSRPDYVVKLDFTDSTTFGSALQGIDRLLLIRPSALFDAERVFKPFLGAAKQAGIRQIAFLSVQGAEHNPMIPHHKIEKLIVETGIVFTFLRSSFFMQNLCTTHRDEIRLRNEIFVPAGNGSAYFVDARDMATIAAHSLTTHSDQYRNRSYEITGSEALTYLDMCQILTTVLGRSITYRNPSALQFIWRKWRQEHYSLPATLITTTIHTITRFSRVARPTNETDYLLGRPPITFRQFATDHRQMWIP